MMLLKKIMIKTTMARWIISRWKNDFVSIDKAFEIALSKEEIKAAKLYRSYQRQLKALQCLRL